MTPWSRALPPRDRIVPYSRTRRNVPDIADIANPLTTTPKKSG